MAKNDITKHEFYEYIDEYTGKTVTRLTSPENLCHHPYFYNNLFTKDSKHIIYAIEKCGIRDFYKMNIESGVSIQLTEGGGIHDFSANLSNDDKFLYFRKGNNIIKMSMASLEEEIIYSTPEGWSGYHNPGISSDEKFIATMELFNEDKLNFETGWSNFEKQWAKRPRCRLVYIDVDNRAGKVIYEENCWLGHPQIRPHDNKTVSFCHEGPAHKIDARLWLINSDGSNMRCARPQKENEMITHEYWLSDGSRIAYVYRMQDKVGKSTEELVDPETFMPKEESGQLKEKIMLLNPETLEEDFLMECSKYCHFISDKTNRRIVGDGQLPDQHFIYLIDVTARSEERLCSHGSSWKAYGTSQDSHPHPAFSPDGRKVVFTSDMHGLPSIYLTYIQHE
jgi:oligogalacturonide lyase